MKISWREHEMIFITLLVIVQVIIYLKALYEASLGTMDPDYAKGFTEAGLSFEYWKQIFVPKLMSVLLVFAAYLSVNLIILPLIKKISFHDVEQFFSLNILRAAAAIIGASYLLTRSICNLIYGKQYKIPVDIPVDSLLLKKYVGHYALTPTFTLHITVEGGKLAAQADNQEKTVLLAEKENYF